LPSINYDRSDHPLVDSHRALSLFGARDQHLRAIRETLGVSITHRDGEIRVTGEEAAVARARDALAQLSTQLDEEGVITVDHVSDVLGLVTGKRNGAAPAAGGIDVQTARRISPRTQGQADISNRSATTTSHSRSARPERARRIWRWPWPVRR